MPVADLFLPCLTITIQLNLNPRATRLLSHLGIIFLAPSLRLCRRLARERLRCA